MAKNYYIILGISPDSTQTDIKVAYRRLAKLFHPDHYGRDNLPFQDIHEAYSVLSNPKSRKKYDSSLRTSTRQYHSQAVGTDHYRSINDDVEPLIYDQNEIMRKTKPLWKFHPHKQIFFTSMSNHFFRRLDKPLYHGEANCDYLAYEVSLTRRQAETGGNIVVDLPLEMRCPSCVHDSLRTAYTCRRCNGRGFLKRAVPVHINYPAGSTENCDLKLAVKSPGLHLSHINIIFRVR